MKSSETQKFPILLKYSTPNRFQVLLTLFAASLKIKKGTLEKLFLSFHSKLSRWTGTCFKGAASCFNN